ncbi:hypothetical protein [Rhabdothermincola sediminis]|uniref:hypothetical protein n=1 Tax=Rhabdothermincola sediminis TaxID=2751370 RepID=UPI001AA098E4|nr:hypothetical protein [Rhabdothermincola sediminis]
MTVRPSPAVSLCALGLLAAAVVVSPAGAAQVSDGQRTLQASRTEALDPTGERITVTGAGFDVSKGIYVAFCAIPPPGMPPSPCGGGEDRAGSTGASAWISSNPPPYAVGLPTPYGPEGSFTVELAIQPVINATTDCRRVRCAIVTRNDHTRSSDRSQDLFLPVTFRAESTTPSPGTPPAGAATPTSPLDPGAAAIPPTDAASTTSTTSTIPTPQVTLSPDGRTAMAGEMRLELSHVVLDPTGDELDVTGSGFRRGRELQVALCATPVVGEAPVGCGPAANTVPAEADGAMAVTLSIDGPVLGEHDCRELPCAVVTRDPLTPTDRSQELAVPVRFASTELATDTSGTDPRGDDQQGTDQAAADQAEREELPLTPWTVALVVGTVLVITATRIAARRWRHPVERP